MNASESDGRTGGRTEGRTEGQIARKFKRQGEVIGARVETIHGSLYTIGLPDKLIVLGDGTIVLAELKAGNPKTTARLGARLRGRGRRSQRGFMERCGELGAHAYMIASNRHSDRWAFARARDLLGADRALEYHDGVRALWSALIDDVRRHDEAKRTKPGA